VTSSSLRQPNDATKITSQNFFILGLQIKITGYASDSNTNNNNKYGNKLIIKFLINISAFKQLDLRGTVYFNIVSPNKNTE